MESKIKTIIENASEIVIIQADNPDGDSLASSLALEQILSEQGKKVHLYCGVAIPNYLRYLQGWDRVQNILPTKFDASIIADTSAINLLEQLQKTNSIGWLKTKPCIILDHHTDVKSSINFATVTYIEEAVSTGELIYELAQSLPWRLNLVAMEMIMTSILSDSLGFSGDRTSARTLHIAAELTEKGVSIAKLDNLRRSLQTKSPELLKYKADLLKRVEYSADGRIATITIPWEEIEKYSNEYNPSILVLEEMRMVTDVRIAIAFKTYLKGRITAKIRSNYGYGVATKLALSFGGGGHPYAAGFKVIGQPFDEVKFECVKRACELLDTLKKDSGDESIQYAYSVS